MASNDPTVLNIVDRQSLIHVGSLDSFDITEGGKSAARLILEYLDKPDPDKLHEAIDIYEDIIPNENFGGEYTALEWLCRYFLMDDKKKQDIEGIPAVRSFKNMMIKNDHDNLKTYLQYKYHIVEYGDGDNTELKARMRFLEDYILFNNPDRERWETTRENIERLALKSGMEIADVGCGPGYYSFKFSDIVGPEGKVYAIETNPRHLEYLEEYVSENDISNVAVTRSSFEGIGLSPDIKVDIVYICSLYHNVYAAFTDAERDSFVGSIRHALRSGGRLIIVDNDLVTDGELPYHGPYVNKNMIVAQLHYYGFKLADSFQFTPQRYGLIFDMVDIPESVDRDIADRIRHTVNVNSSGSLIRYRIIGTATSGYTVRGKRCGRMMYEGLKEDSEPKLKEAYRMFEELYPKERVGDDYTALMWFITYYLADEDKKAEMTEDKLTRFYAGFFCDNGYDRLKTYLLYKFHLELENDNDPNEDTNYDYTGKDFPIPTINEWNEFLIFNNPNRFMWEKTEEFLAETGIKEGETVADIGCGGGFFTWKFAQAVGERGMVYATEINEDALHYVQDFKGEYGVAHIRPIEAKMNDCTLPEDSLDMIFMCSMYHAVYITDIEFVKDDFIASLRKALKKDGRLVIVDNNITDRGVPSYYGPGICPELVIAQLQYYGFRLVSEKYPIPQRFVLVFKKEEA
ncbi:MAG: methyltransferase domain-containing protein [Lachnospiraceae bacterium]|nr:methyltransferase domain-containing protein [Lachnospiraceae bacterium]